MKRLERHEKDGVVWFADGDIRCVHGFSTRLGGVSEPEHLASMNMGRNLGDDPAAVDENYRRFCAAIGSDPARVVYTKQIHSATVLTVGASNAGATYECDGFVTREKGVALTVRTADCVPILFWSPDGVVGACHAGWRGTVAGIQRITVERMAELGADPAGIRAAVGASIRGCCYEVGDDFVEAVAASPYGGICLDFIGQKDGRPHADLLGMNVALLAGAGVPEEHIAVSDYCTCCKPDLFFSHRASKGKRGVMCALIEL
ncbi:MAG: peptidoglycan editing factor PgeF [Clostridia bacterium]|nr:peptidoglycan editing factor PgeF [Clostridia bacterium]